ncbi:MAG: phosphate-starvation-inducible PsiE family protein [Chloroflexota bacterium]
MFKNLRKMTFRRGVAMILILILSVVTILSIPSLVILIREELLAPPVWVITVEKIRSVLDLVLWILIIIELTDSIRVYLEEQGLHLETILSLSMVAIARKIIAVRLRDYEPVMVLGMAALVVALGITFYLVRKSRSFPGENQQEENHS